MSDSQVEAVEAIRTVLDKLFAPESGPVELADVVYRRMHGVTLPTLTSAEVAAARRALEELGDA